MAIVNEKPKSRKLGPRSHERQFTIVNATSEQDALTSLISYVGLTYGGLVLDENGVSVDEVYPGIFDGSVKFIPPEEKERKDEQEQAQQPGDPPEYSFDISGGTFRLTHAIATRSYVPPGGTAVDFKNAIGVTKEGVEGCDIPVCEYKWEEKHMIRTSQLTQAYIDGLERLYGRLNNATFRGKPEKHVRFMGATGSCTATSKKVPITFRFESGKHLKDHTIGDITGIEKLPFEYLWVSFDNEHDNVAQKVRKTALQVDVNTVHQYGDFAALGIGTQVLRLHS